MGQDQVENPGLSGPLLSPYTMWPPEASLPINFLETSWAMRPTAMSWGHERNTIFYLPGTKAERAGVTGLDCGQKKAVPLGVWSTSPHS